MFVVKYQIVHICFIEHQCIIMTRVEIIIGNTVGSVVFCQAEKLNLKLNELDQTPRLIF